MKIEAAPHHRIMAAIMLMSLCGCLLYVFLNPHPSGAHSTIPLIFLLLLGMGAIFIPCYRDHAGVTYEVNDAAVILWRKGKMRKIIQLSEVTSVRNDKPKKSVILHRKGFWRSPIYLHPKTNAAELFEAIHLRADPSDATHRRPSAPPA